jgi:hypothetical protein
MSTERWSELSAEHEVRYTGDERFFVITMSKTSGVDEGLYGLVVGVSAPEIKQEFTSAYSHRSIPRFVLSREFQSTCWALRSPANKTGNSPPKQAVRSAPISGREGER